VALALAEYLQRRPEFAGTSGASVFEESGTTLLTSGNAADVSTRAGHLFGRPLAFRALSG
jgi:hypothetical protein